MKKYMALYMATPAAIEKIMQATPEQSKAGMDLWTKWSDSHKKAIVDLGMPLGKSKRITSGGMSDTRNDITGYSIVQGDSPDQVAKLFRGHPHLGMEGTSIDIVELVSVPGM